MAFRGKETRIGSYLYSEIPSPPQPRPFGESLAPSADSSEIRVPMRSAFRYRLVSKFRYRDGCTQHVGSALPSRGTTFDLNRLNWVFQISAELIQRQSFSRGRRGSENNFDRAASTIDRDHSKDSENPGILNVLAILIVLNARITLHTGSLRYVNN